MNKETRHLIWGILLAIVCGFGVAQGITWLQNGIITFWTISFTLLQLYSVILSMNYIYNGIK